MATLSKITKVSLAFYFGFRLISAGLSDAHDFQVYWNAAQAAVAGISPYAFTPAQAGMVFKYPPWVLTLFLPLGFLSLTAARAIWVGVELWSLSYVFYWLRRNGVSLQVLMGTAIAFWWIFLGHFYAGQISLPLTALALFAFSYSGKFNYLLKGFSVFCFSSKIFSLVSWVGLPRKKWVRTVASAVAWLCFSQLGLLLFCSWMAHVHVSQFSVLDLYQGWWVNSQSSVQGLGSEVVFGQANHGMPALLLRIFDIHQAGFEIVASLIVAVVGGLVWFVGSKSLSPEKRWAGWLALGVIAHPLAWHHSFVGVFPLLVFALEDGLSVWHLRKFKVPFVMAAIGVVCVGLILPQTLSVERVRPFELAGVKSWGVVLAAWALCFSARLSLVSAPFSTKEVRTV